MKRTATAALLAVLVFAAGCAGRVVPLEYYAVDVSPAACKSALSVYKLTDARASQAIGVTKEGDTFLADSSTPVADWVSMALFQEFKANGCQTQYTTLADNASKGLVVTGEVTKVDLRQKDSARYSCEVRVRLRVLKDGREAIIQDFGSEVDKVYIISKDNPKKIMTECLTSLMGEVMESLLPKIKAL